MEVVGHFGRIQSFQEYLEEQVNILETWYMESLQVRARSLQLGSAPIMAQLRPQDLVIPMQEKGLQR